MSTENDNMVQTWMKLGGPQSGTIAALAIGQAEECFIFIGTKVGLFRSSVVSGSTVAEWGSWERLSGAPIGVMALAVSPDFAHDHMIVAGTDSGIYVSRDAGLTWRA